MVNDMGREEKLGLPLSVRFTPSVRLLIKELADKSDRSENGVVQAIVEDWLSRNSKNRELGVRLLGIPEWQMDDQASGDLKKSPAATRK